MRVGEQANLSGRSALNDPLERPHNDHVRVDQDDDAGRLERGRKGFEKSRVRHLLGEGVHDLRVPGEAFSLSTGQSVVKNDDIARVVRDPKGS
jgi:hypothetical protein